jgi:hypothetical protein
MDYRDFTKWNAETVSSASPAVVMRLFKDGVMIGTYEEHSDGRLVPEPPAGAADLLHRQAAAARGSPLLALSWVEMDGWLSTQHNGHHAKLRESGPNEYKLIINQKSHTASIFGGLLAAQKAVEGMLLSLGRSGAS